MSSPEMKKRGGRKNPGDMSEDGRPEGVMTRSRTSAAGSNQFYVTEDEPQISGDHFPMYYHPHHESDDLPPDSPLAKQQSTWQSLRGDIRSVLLLLFLYLLQGIPLGLTASIPLVLQSRQVTYAQQAVFSFAYWPFSLKLLWAPIVDSLHLRSVGRRKSWLIPTQYLIGIFMLILSGHVSSILGDGVEGETPNVTFLTAVFFCFNFLAATQDIAVDGWALTMLSKRNLGYASTCNAVGQTAGYFLGNVVFLALESADFCNRYLRSSPQPQGLVTLAGDFVYFWGIVFLVTTTLVLVLKREVDNSVEGGNSDELDDLGIRKTYRLLWDIIRLKPVLTLVVIHLTAKVAFAAADGITGLKLVELGVPKDKLALLAVPLVPLQIVLPWVIGRYTAGPKPLNVYLSAYPYRILLGIGFALLVHWTPSWKLSDGSFPVLYYALIVAVYCVHQVTVYSIFVSTMAFHAQISDPLVGGTYMTLMNTVSNLGGNWPVTVSLSVVDDLTWKECLKPSNLAESLGQSCVKDEDCSSIPGASCVTNVDGYYILSGTFAVIGLLWWRLMRRRMERLQDIDKKNWSCPVPR